MTNLTEGRARPLGTAALERIAKPEIDRETNARTLHLLSISRESFTPKCIYQSSVKNSSVQLETYKISYLVGLVPSASGPYKVSDESFAKAKGPKDE